MEDSKLVSIEEVKNPKARSTSTMHERFDLELNDINSQNLEVDYDKDKRNLDVSDTSNKIIQDSNQNEIIDGITVDDLIIPK